MVKIHFARTCQKLSVALSAFIFPAKGSVSPRPYCRGGWLEIRSRNRGRNCQKIPDRWGEGKSRSGKCGRWTGRDNRTVSSASYSSVKHDFPELSRSYYTGGQGNKETRNLQHDRQDCAPCSAGKRIGRRSSWSPSSSCCRSKAG